MPDSPAQTDDDPSSIPLQDLGLLPGGKSHAEMPSRLVTAPSTSLAVVAALTLPQGSGIRQVSQETNGVAITATQIDVPGGPTVVGTSVIGTPLELEVAGTCSVPLQVPDASPLPSSITTPDTIFRTGRGYTAEQLRSDLETVAAGETGLSSAEAGLAYVVARTRLNSAMYTPIEQFNDLQWAHHEPRTEVEGRDQFDARARLNEAGIPWSDPRIQAWVDNKLDVAIATDPTSPARYQAPPLFSSGELRQQQIEANRVDITANDIRQGTNDLLAAITYGPALVLWEAAHDRGDHSGADIAWAAAELGMNVVGIVPGVGPLTGIAAKGTIRRLSPEFWNVLTTTDNVVDAVRAGQALQDARVVNSALDYRQKFVLDRSLAPSPGVNAGDKASAPLSSAAAPGQARAPGLYTTVQGLPEAAVRRPMQVADDFIPTPAAVNGVALPLNQILANESMIAHEAKNFVADVEQFVMLEARLPATAMAGIDGRGAAAAGDRIPAGQINPRASHDGAYSDSRGSEPGGRSEGTIPSPPRGPIGPTVPRAPSAEGGTPQPDHPKSVGRTDRSDSGFIYEQRIVGALGGTGEFKVGKRTFDGRFVDDSGVEVWYEAKAGAFWERPAHIVKFKNQVGEQRKIALDAGVEFRVISERPIPAEVKNWLDKKDIRYEEGVGVE
ncbi:hypothetical protein ACFO5K_08225 [Nocardia halotolerans]|uniref:Tox-REase-5 domain-containing protein n=1 Tax=Nocardia halotolerans TaxID=1755878 RepID=A0ABV8VDK1_9NOCA